VAFGYISAREPTIPCNACYTAPARTNSRVAGVHQLLRAGCCETLSSRPAGHPGEDSSSTTDASAPRGCLAYGRHPVGVGRRAVAGMEVGELKNALFDNVDRVLVADTTDGMALGDCTLCAWKGWKTSVRRQTFVATRKQLFTTTHLPYDER